MYRLTLITKNYIIIYDRIYIYIILLVTIFGLISLAYNSNPYVYNKYIFSEDIFIFQLNMSRRGII